MPDIPRAVCVECGLVMRPAKIGMNLEAITEQERSYYLVAADLYYCSKCGTEIVVGFSQAPFAEHFEPSYKETRDRLRETRPDRFLQFRWK